MGIGSCWRAVGQQRVKVPSFSQLLPYHHERWTKRFPGSMDWPQRLFFTAFLVLAVAIDGTRADAMLSGNVFCDQCKDGQISLFDYPVYGVRVELVCTNSNGQVTMKREEVTNLVGNYVMRFDGVPNLSSCRARVSGQGSTTECGSPGGPAQSVRLAFRILDLEMYTVASLIAQPSRPAAFCPRSAIPLPGPANPTPGQANPYPSYPTPRQAHPYPSPSYPTPGQANPYPYPEPPPYPTPGQANPYPYPEPPPYSPPGQANNPYLEPPPYSTPGQANNPYPEPPPYSTPGHADHYPEPPPYSTPGQADHYPEPPPYSTPGQADHYPEPPPYSMPGQANPYPEPPPYSTPGQANHYPEPPPYSTPGQANPYPEPPDLVPTPPSPILGPALPYPGPVNPVPVPPSPNHGQDSPYPGIVNPAPVPPSPVPEQNDPYSPVPDNPAPVPPSPFPEQDDPYSPVPVNLAPPTPIPEQTDPDPEQVTPVPGYPNPNPGPITPAPPFRLPPMPPMPPLPFLQASVCSHQNWTMPEYRCYWRALNPDMKVTVIFGSLAGRRYGTDMTLEQGLEGRGDPYQTLLREGITALLNSYHNPLFQFSPIGVVQHVNWALMGSSRQVLLTGLDFIRANSGSRVVSCRFKPCK